MGIEWTAEEWFFSGRVRDGDTIMSRSKLFQTRATAAPKMWLLMTTQHVYGIFSFDVDTVWVMIVGMIWNRHCLEDGYIDVYYFMCIACIVAGNLASKILFQNM